MTGLEELDRQRGAGGLVHRLSQRLGAVRRRDVFVGAALAGSALVTDPKAYALRPMTALDTICGPGNTAASGWTVFCCTINKGVNACPPGSFAAGWWKAADSTWCGGGYRYIVDCNASCSKCSTGCSDGICDSKCWSCSCGSGSTATCDQRRVCCNAFRYGQCNTGVKCSGGVHCRVVSCIPPYRWANCTTTSLSDDRTAEHSAPCIPQWGPIEQHYNALGGPASFLHASLGPVRTLGDGIGTYVMYSGGTIYDTPRTDPAALNSFVYGEYAKAGGPSGSLGYPTRDRYVGLTNGGWLQPFERGAITDSATTTTQVVWGERWTVWVANGRESGSLGYPTAAVTYPAGGWIQTFQNGCIVDSDATTTQVVWGYRWTVWQANGRESGVLGYPTSAVTYPAHGWIQTFQNGCIVDSDATATQVVSGVMWAAWQAAGLSTGVLGYPSAAVSRSTVGSAQAFQNGQLWALAGGPAYRVYGSVLAAWRAAGGAGGLYGYPVSDTMPAAGGGLTCTFQGGTITA